jgi:hypothetical protein
LDERLGHDGPAVGQPVLGQQEGASASVCGVMRRPCVGKRRSRRPRPRARAPRWRRHPGWLSAQSRRCP